MARVEILSRRCPVCGYEYEVRKYFRIETHKRKIMTPNDNKEHVNPQDYNPFNTCKYVTNIEKKEVLCCTKTTGDQKFLLLQIPNYETDSDGRVTGILVKRYGMFCPKCGVFLHEDICTISKNMEISDNDIPQ